MAKRGGFTLLEVTCTVALISLSGALLVTSVRGAQGKASSAALAEAVADEIRSARQLAIGRGCPVAVVFPSEAKQKSHCDSLSLLAGASFPQQIKVIHFGGDFPGCTLFNGSWAPASGAAVTTNLALPGSKWSSLKLENWLPAANQSDYCLCFLPDGTVKTNNLAAFDGAYHVVVSSGIGSVTGGPAPSSGLNSSFNLNYRSPQLAGESKTICVDASGAVSIQPGIWDSNLTPRGVMANLSAPAAAPAAVALPDASGQIVSVNVVSKGEPPSGPSDPDVTVALDGYVTLRTIAKDPAKSGQTLYCNWTVTKTSGSGTGTGAYSIPVAVNRGTAMQWNANAISTGVGAWVSNWQWRPPADAGTNDRYKLDLVIQDADGVTVTVGPSRKVDVVPPGKVVFESDIPGTFGLFTMNTDGWCQQRFHIFPHKGSNPSPFSEGWPSASLDGNRIAFQSNRSGGTAMQAYVTDRSGSSLVRVTNNPLGIECPSMSPWGDRVAYKKYVAGSPQLWVVDADGGNDHVVDVGPVSVGSEAGQAGRNELWDRIAWNPDDNETLYYTKNHQIYQVAATSGGSGALAYAGSSPNGARAPYLLRIGSAAVPDVFYTSDDGDPYIYHNASVAAGSPGTREEQPCPWNDAGTLRAFVIRSADGITGQIWRYTLTNSAAVPTDDRRMTDPAFDARCPVFLP